MMPPRKLVPPGPLESLGALWKRQTTKGFVPAIGQTPHSVVWSENKWRLLRFTPDVRRFATPIVMVPSLINRWYVLDLGPERSFIEWHVG
jgi:polyhydroxyalkanoate synthase